MEDLHKLYPKALPNIPISKMKGATVDKKVAYLCTTLKSIRDSWARTHKWMAKFRYEKIGKMEWDSNMEQLVLATFDSMIKAARELFDLLQYEELKEDYSPQDRTLAQYHLGNKIVLPTTTTDDYTKIRESANISNSPPRLSSLGVKGTQNSTPLKQKDESVEALKTEVKEVINESTKVPVSSMNENASKKDHDKTGEIGIPSAPLPLAKLPTELVQSTPPPPPPPPPPVMPSKGSVPTELPPNKSSSPPPPPIPSKGSVPNAMPLKRGPGPPPPPPSGVGKLLLQKRATTKLKTSTQMPNLFRDLKGKMEGSSLAVSLTKVRKVQLGGFKGGKEGLAASLAELTKRSTYFQQVEEDVQKYAKPIIELKVIINSFQAKDMVELLKFRSKVESILSVLTDESQVLAKFEGFPTKKLETVRMAAALYSKFDTVVTTVKNWEIAPPLRQLLDKVDSYFRKIKVEIDAFERTKDEESKKFKSHNIDFDFNIVTRIKELMVDLSSSCMELALKERGEAKAAKRSEQTGSKSDQKMKENIKMLWRVFQLAFWVYSFAGGQDDRADKLAKELANEILIDSPNQ